METVTSPRATSSSCAMLKLSEWCAEATLLGHRAVHFLDGRARSILGIPNIPLNQDCRRGKNKTRVNQNRITLLSAEERLKENFFCLGVRSHVAERGAQLLLRHDLCFFLFFATVKRGRSPWKPDCGLARRLLSSKHGGTRG